MKSPPAGASRDYLVAISLIAGVGYTASAEYNLARAIGSPVPVAVLLPLALDVYVVAAIRRNRGRDIALSLLLMGVAQVSAHLLESRVVVVSVPLVVAVSLLIPLVIWRVHALAVLPQKLHAKAGTAPGTEPAPAAGAEPVATVERVPVPQPTPVPATEPTPVPPASRPELAAVPDSVPAPVPVRPRRRTTGQPGRNKPRSTGTKTGQKAASAASFDEHVKTATAWLAAEPDLSGTDIGKKLGTGDSYGRRVRRAALGTAATGPAHLTTNATVGQGGEGYN
ncbi:hypothetical protein GCM10009837_07300 [Streptomyces durmitorensis]|uniref:DUF2637 domain-containing protein n=1 Tax=Streptomyces durmitorensis TaxID=319947 RepID=A0ABY4PMX7_9ACTN|nr:hypothetical protein [Streptomyces durmitorensis]UQT54378.1 hypothetical protein M4V62_04345 [Streptomyces durmitorensis]